MASPQETVLEDLLAQAAHDPAQRPLFVRALLDSEVYVLGTHDEEREELNVVNFFDADGMVVPMFTSPDMVVMTLDQMPDCGPSCVRLLCRHLWAATNGERFVLNPHGPHSKVFIAAEIAALLDGREPGLREYTGQEPLRIEVAPASDSPAQLTDVLRRFFADRPSVAEARLGWARLPDGGECYLVTVASDSAEDAIRGFGSLGVESITGGVCVDVVVEPLAQAGSILTGVEPFHRADFVI